jgi:S1-C subfamily serine protease
MFNKVVIGILIFLLLLTGALGFYAFRLTEEIDALGEQLTVSQQRQAAEISTLRHELTTFREETLASSQETLARIDTLDDGLRGVTAELEQSVINAGKLYQEVSQSVVEVSDGERIVGSGFAFDSEGHILTPHHVVEDLDQIDVILADGRTSSASIVGTCEFSDIAVLTLEQRLTIQALTLADSSMVRVGEPIIVIGNPLELPGTVTSGIVSQTCRFIEVEYDGKTRWVANLIQFDAPVNFGNSGSPLLNSKGEVIGMVVARVDPELGDGLYQAISSNKVSRVALSLIKRGYFDYPWLGVEITDLTLETVRDRELETANGVLVKTVIADTPAEAVGIEVDDIIVAIDGTPVRGAADLTCYLGEYSSPGDEVTLTLIRDGAEIELSLEVGKR